MDAAEERHRDASGSRAIGRMNIGIADSTQLDRDSPASLKLFARSKRQASATTSNQGIQAGDHPHSPIGRSPATPRQALAVVRSIAMGTHPVHSLQHIAQQASWAGAAEASGLALRFGLALLIARLLGPAGLGFYVIAIALANGAAIIARIGLDQAMLRFIPYHRTRREPGETVGIFLFSTLLVAMLSIAASLTVFFAAPLLADAWNRPELSTAGRLIALIIPFIALGQVWRSGLRGFQDVRLAALVEQILVPLATISSLVVILLVRPGEPLAAVAAATIAYWLAGLISLGALFIAVRRTNATPVYRMSTWMKFALPMSLEGGLLILVFWTDQLMIGWFLDASSVGIYASAMRIAMLVGLPLLAVNTIFAPTIASLHAQGDRTTLQRMYARLTMSTATLGGCIALVLWMSGEWLLGMFGPAFVAGQLALAILIGGQIVNAGTGSSGMILAMTDRAGWRLANAALTAGLNVALNWLLIPHWGIAGAATATAISIGFINLLQLVEVRWLVGLWAYDWRSASFSRIREIDRQAVA